MPLPALMSVSYLMIRHPQQQKVICFSQTLRPCPKQKVAVLDISCIIWHAQMSTKSLLANISPIAIVAVLSLNMNTVAFIVQVYDYT